MSAFGKWSEKSVTHKGWNYVDIKDLGSSSQFCEMCEHQAIRYVHYMQHSNYPEILEVGCVCAEKMSEDYTEPKKRERELINRNRRRKRFHNHRNWKTLKNSNYYINTKEHYAKVYKKGNFWSGSVINKLTGKKRESQKNHDSKEAIQLIIFDIIEGNKV